jgi:hypothetical protein
MKDDAKKEEKKSLSKKKTIQIFINHFERIMRRIILSQLEKTRILLYEILMIYNHFCSFLLVLS